MSEKGEDPQSSGGGSVLPPDPDPSKPDLSKVEQYLTDVIHNVGLEPADISPKGAKVPQGGLPHGAARVWIAAGVLAIALIGPCTPWVPDNVKTGFLAIAASVSTSLFKGFEKH